MVEEIFAGRARLDDGQLVPHGRADAMIHGAARSLAHVEAMFEAQALITVSRKRLPTPIASICVHGDSPDAVATAANVRAELVRKGYQLRPLGTVTQPREGA